MHSARHAFRQTRSPISVTFTTTKHRRPPKVIDHYSPRLIRSRFPVRHNHASHPSLILLVTKERFENQDPNLLPELQAYLMHFPPKISLSNAARRIPIPVLGSQIPVSPTSKEGV